MCVQLVATNTGMEKNNLLPDVAVFFVASMVQLGCG
jgi:hypothetical protein